MPPPGFEMLSLPPPTGSFPVGLRPFLRPLPEGPGLLVLRGEVPAGSFTAVFTLTPSPRTATFGGLPFEFPREIPFGLIDFAIRLAFLSRARPLRSQHFLLGPSEHAPERPVWGLQLHARVYASVWLVDQAPALNDPA